MATIRVHGKVEGLPEGSNPLIVVELLVPCVGGHRVAAVILAGPTGEFHFDTVNVTDQVTPPWQGAAIDVRASIATADGLVRLPSDGMKHSAAGVVDPTGHFLSIRVPGNIAELITMSPADHMSMQVDASAANLAAAELTADSSAGAELGVLLFKSADQGPNSNLPPIYSDLAQSQASVHNIVGVGLSTVRDFLLNRGFEPDVVLQTLNGRAS